MVCITVKEANKKIIVSHVGNNDMLDGNGDVISWEGNIEYHFAEGYILLTNYKRIITACVHFDMIEIEK
jgi:hypothetical protein